MLDACCSLAYERIILPLSAGFKTKFAMHVAFRTNVQTILKLFMGLVAKMVGTKWRNSIEIFVSVD